MVKHEAHTVTVSVNSPDALAESRRQVVEGFEQDVGQDCSFQMAPQSLDQIQAGAVGWQPVDCDQIGIGLEPLLDYVWCGETVRCRTPSESCDRRTP